MASCSRSVHPGFGGKKVPLVLIPFWVQIHEVPIGLYSENLAVNLGKFLGSFTEYDASNLGKENRIFMRVRVQAKMMTGVETAEMGWDLSIRAQSRRALTMKSVWLREEWEGGSDGIQEVNRNFMSESRGMEQKKSVGKIIDLVLGITLDGGLLRVAAKQASFLTDNDQQEMEHDLEDIALVGEDGKKRSRRESDDLSKYEELYSSARNKKLTDLNQLTSAAAKRQADRTL
ncbi:hypothetical protein Goarm_018473 [Gossypium armourianum]|uniref:DUF4283 domain-containing protein n=1 Tax=Gossypium armourianum TaxID=34283 RepID=A0A7J9IHM4_9ROSI|nr:hypothetical protein [Gossypium armourianum]